MYFLMFNAAGWLGGILWCVWKRAKRGPEITSIFLTAHFAASIGCAMLFSFTGHFFLSEKVAEQIGWISNGFQKEVAIFSLGLGVCGLLCCIIRDGFRVAVALIYLFFMAGAGYIHIDELISLNNINPGNAGIIIPDFLLPLTVIILLIINHKLTNKFNQTV